MNRTGTHTYHPDQAKRTQVPPDSYYEPAHEEHEDCEECELCGAPSTVNYGGPLCGYCLDETYEQDAADDLLAYRKENPE